MDFAVSNRPLDKFKADALILVLGKNGDLPRRCRRAPATSLPVSSRPAILTAARAR